MKYLDDFSKRFLTISLSIAAIFVSMSLFVFSIQKSFANDVIPTDVDPQVHEGNYQALGMDGEIYIIRLPTATNASKAHGYKIDKDDFPTR